MLQFDHGSIGKILAEIQNIGNIRAAPTVDALVLITHHEQVPVFGSKHGGYLVLQAAGILVFVYMYVFKALGVFGKHFRIVCEKFIGFDEKIIVIHCVGGFEFFLISLVHVTDQHSVPITAFLAVLLGRKQIGLCVVDMKRHLGIKALLFNVFVG